jgi:hypothetical protein
VRLFGADPVVQKSLLAKLINADNHGAKKLAMEQAAIQRGLRPDEKILRIGADVSGEFGVAVVTNQRVFQVSSGKIISEAPGGRIGGMKQEVMPDGTIRVSLSGAWIHGVKFRTRQDAQAFVFAINNWLVGMPSKPRDIRTLYPGYFENLLRVTGKPVTPVNMSRIIERCAMMMTAASAMPYFEQANDPTSRKRFLARFANGGADPQRAAQIVDDMIDFLWEWSPNCHNALRQQVDRIEQSLTGPRSYLHTCGPELPLNEGLGTW